MKDGEIVVLLDPVEEALLGAQAKSHGITKEEELRRVISAALAEIARSKMDRSDLSHH